MGHKTMEDKQIMIIIVAVIAVVAVVLAFTVFSNDSYKNVDEDYVKMPAANESVRFTGTYFGKTTYGSQGDLSSDIDVIRVGLGNTFVFVTGDNNQLDGKQGDDFTLEGKFNVGAGKQKAVVNGLSVTGYEFIPDKIG